MLISKGIESYPPPQYSQQFFISKWVAPATAQSSPPYLGAGLVQLRFLFCIPSPQVVEHALHISHPVQPPCTEFIIHVKYVFKENRQTLGKNFRFEIATTNQHYLSSCMYRQQSVHWGSDLARIYNRRTHFHYQRNYWIPPSNNPHHVYTSLRLVITSHNSRIWENIRILRTSKNLRRLKKQIFFISENNTECHYIIYQ